MVRASIVVSMLLALVAVTASASKAAFPGGNGRIAYWHVGESGPGRIYSVTSTGTTRRLLTPDGKGSSLSPAYSPRGRMIVFVRAFKQSDLWTMRADGRHERRLTRTTGIDETDPGWSPDGREIVFAVTRPASQEGIWVIGVDGSGRHQLTTGADSGPSWSPDGSEIAFTRYDATTATAGIFVVPSGGGTPTSLSTTPGISDFGPDWSPDGSRILFASDRPDTFQSDLWTMKSDGSDPRRVTNTPFRDEHDPTWSPNGRWIAYIGEGSTHGASSYQLYVSRANGSKRRLLTHACGECAIINEAPSWQPRPR